MLLQKMSSFKVSSNTLETLKQLQLFFCCCCWPCAPSQNLTWDLCMHKQLQNPLPELHSWAFLSIIQASAQPPPKHLTEWFMVRPRAVMSKAGLQQQGMFLLIHASPWAVQMHSVLELKFSKFARFPCSHKSMKVVNPRQRSQQSVVAFCWSFFFYVCCDFHRGVTSTKTRMEPQRTCPFMSEKWGWSERKAGRFVGRWGSQAKPPPYLVCMSALSGYA